MSKITDKLIEIQELLEAGMDVELISKIARVPVDWVIAVAHEMMGHYGGYDLEE